MKLKYLFIILFSVGIAAQQYKDIRELDGFFWEGLDDNEKILLINGYVLGIVAMSEAMLYTYADIEESIVEYGFWGVTNDEILYAINNFYAIEENMKKPLYIVPQWLKRQGFIKDNLRRFYEN